jgi:rSAM/selenodomain-associated transferase 1
MPDAELIVVFAKPAVPGLVKTRLVPTFTPDEAAQFHLAALADTVAAASQACPERVALCVAGDQDDLGEFRALYPERPVWRQQGRDLGERLSAAFDEAFAHGAVRALVVGSDHPTLPPAHLEEALRLLRGVDVVLGPSRDGGYYAVGVRRTCWPKAGSLFREIPWSTPDVLQVSLERARHAALQVAMTPEWYDVDTSADLDLLRRDADPASSSARFLSEIARRRK